MEARSQGRVGRYLEEENAMGGTTDSHRVIPACRERTLRVRKPLKSWWCADRPGRHSAPALANGTKGRSRREAHPLLGRGNLRRQKPKGVTGMKQGRRGCGRSKASRS